MSNSSGQKNSLMNNSRYELVKDEKFNYKDIDSDASGKQPIELVLQDIGGTDTHNELNYELKDQQSRKNTAKLQANSNYYDTGLANNNYMELTPNNFSKSPTNLRGKLSLPRPRDSSLNKKSNQKKDPNNTEEVPVEDNDAELIITQLYLQYVDEADNGIVFKNYFKFIKDSNLVVLEPSNYNKKVKVIQELYQSLSGDDQVLNIEEFKMLSYQLFVTDYNNSADSSRKNLREKTKDQSLKVAYELKLVNLHKKMSKSIKYAFMINPKSNVHLKHYLQFAFKEDYDNFLKLMYFVDFDQEYEIRIDDYDAENFFIMKRFLDKVGVIPKLLKGEESYFLMSKACEVLTSLEDLKYQYVVLNERKCHQKNNANIDIYDYISISNFEKFKIMLVVIFDCILMEHPEYHKLKKDKIEEMISLFDSFIMFICKNWYKATILQVSETNHYNREIKKMQEFLSYYDFKNYFEQIFLHKKLKKPQQYNVNELNNNPKHLSEFDLKKVRYLTLTTKVFAKTAIDKLEETFMFFADLFISRCEIETGSAKNFKVTFPLYRMEDLLIRSGILTEDINTLKYNLLEEQSIGPQRETDSMSNKDIKKEKHSKFSIDIKSFHSSIETCNNKIRSVEKEIFGSQIALETNPNNLRFYEFTIYFLDIVKKFNEQYQVNLIGVSVMKRNAQFTNLIATIILADRNGIQDADITSIEESSMIKVLMIKVSKILQKNRKIQGYFKILKQRIEHLYTEKFSDEDGNIALQNYVEFLEDLHIIPNLVSYRKAILIFLRFVPVYAYSYLEENNLREKAKTEDPSSQRNVFAFENTKQNCEEPYKNFYRSMRIIDAKCIDSLMFCQCLFSIVILSLDLIDETMGDLEINKIFNIQFSYFPGRKTKTTPNIGENVY